MLCSNCYTGCTQVVTDRCVKYTGTDIPLFGIKTGDSQSYVNQALLGFVSANADGSGIKFTLSPSDTCDLMSQFLEDCKDTTVVDYVRALSKSVCTLDSDLTELSSSFATLEGGYITGCLSVDPTAGTHAVLQATINQTCSNLNAINATNLNLQTNYVRIDDIDDFIADYIANNISEGETGHASKMIPYTVVEYYGTLSNFDATGAGIGEWTNIYLCNGNNNTPDKRGRAAVGTTSGMGGGSFHPDVDPSLSGNPSYSLFSTGGSNTVTLNVTQLPSHTHTGTTSIDPGHSHAIKSNSITSMDPNSSARFEGGGSNRYVVGYNAVTELAGNHSHTFTTNATGGGQAHPNIQPVIACHYIMYIPQ